MNRAGKGEHPRSADVERNTFEADAEKKGVESGLREKHV